MTIKQKILFLRQLGFLIKASISIPESLNMVRGYINDKKFKIFLDSVQANLASGIPFHLAIENVQDKSTSGSRRMFDLSTLSMIRTGEFSGVLGDAMIRASEDLEAQSKIKQEIGSALLYPCMVSVFAILIIMLLLGYVYPQILPIFSSLGAKLPLSTRIVIFLSLIVKQYWLVGCIFIPLFLFCVWLVGVRIRSMMPEKYIHIKRYIETIVFKIPLIGQSVLLFELGKISRTLSVIIKDVDYLSALELASEVTNFLILKDILINASDEIKEGKVLSKFFSKIPLLPSIWSNMLMVGERTGRISESFETITLMHEQDVKRRIATATKLIEPVLMIFTGGLVALIALSIITPLYGITNDLYQ